MKNLIVIFLLVLASSASSQNNIDSLLNLLPEQHGASERAKTNLALGDAYFTYNADSAIFYLERAYQLARLSDQILILSEITAKLAQSYMYLDLVKATEFSIMAVKYSEEADNSTSIIYAHNVLGLVYRTNGDIDKAKSEYEYSLSIAEETKDSMNLARCFNNIGIVHMMSAEYDIGLEYWLKSLEIKIAMDNLLDAAPTMSNIAIYYKDIGRYNEAEEYLNEALNISLDFRDYEAVAFNYSILGDLNRMKGNPLKAIPLYKNALVYFDSSGGYFSKEESLFGLSEAYANSGQFKKAHEIQQDYVKLLKAEYDENNSRLNRELTAQFESEKKEKELELLKSEGDAKDARIKEEEAKTALKEANNFYLTIGLVVTGIVMVFIIFAFRRVREAKKQIEEQKHLVEEKNTEITDSISYAKRLQDAILPTTEVITANLPDNFVLYSPKDIVAGDFYWLEKVGDKILFAAADCTGHGVPGAMVSVVCHNALNRAVREFSLSVPSQILDKVTDLVIETFDKSTEEVKDGMDIALCSFDMKNRKVLYAGANNGLYHVKQGIFSEVKPTKQPVGKYDNRREFENHEIQAEKGDVFYLFTDGFADQFGGERGKKYKYKPFKELLTKLSEEPMSTQKDMLANSFNDWKGDYQQVDDVCVIGVRL
jgi:serine phosphatase RsbU (regulator of sigma subunit)